MDLTSSVFSGSIEERRIKLIMLLWISAFFFHGIADPAITYLAITHLEIGFETNPFIRYLLSKDLEMFLFMHLPLYLIGIVGFAALRWLLKRGSEKEQRRLYYLSTIALIGINMWGALIVFNNMWVIWIMK